MTYSLDPIIKDMTKLAKEALGDSRKAGADACKIVASASYSQRLVVESKDFSLANSLETQKFAVLVHKDQKKGSASTNSRNASALGQIVKDALALAAFSVPDLDLVMPTKDMAPRAKPLPFLFDPCLSALELGAMQEAMQSVLARLLRDPRLALDKFDMATSVSWQLLLNSHGVEQSETQTTLQWDFFGMGRDGEEVGGFDFDTGFSYKQDGFIPKALAEADIFVERVLRNLHPKQCPSYKGPVLLTPRGVQEILLGMMVYHAQGTQVMDGKSRWANSVGQRVVSPQLTLRDLPHDERLSGATSYDADGLPTAPLTLIKEGVLQTHLHDCYTAKRMGAKSTATAGGLFGVCVDPGSAALHDLLRARKTMLMVDRFSGNIDPVKGDFSGVAKNSRLIIDGKDAGAVGETMIAGNVFEVLQGALQVSAEQELVSGHFLSPYILADQFSISGG